VCPYGVFQAKDGPIVIAVGNDAIWKRFARLVSIDPEDERFATNDRRLANTDALTTLLNSALAAHSVREWIQRCDDEGVPAGEVKTFDAVYASPQVRQQNLVWSANHSTLGPIELPGSPLRFGRSPVSLHLAPPTLGEHSDEIRDEIAKGESGEHD
jgi:crotonobetainyl-CoA:carnitine CoA-transferase CaiB-like acyl-CoA transferase